MSDHPNGPHEEVDGRIPPVQGPEETPRGSRLIIRDAPPVQSLGYGDIQDIDIREWDEVSTVPLPCGYAIVLCRKGKRVCIGAASTGARVACTPDDLSAVAGDVARVTARMDEALGRDSGHVLAIKNLRRRLVGLVEVVEGHERVIQEVDATSQASRRTTGYVLTELLRLGTWLQNITTQLDALQTRLVGDEGMGMEQHRDGESLSTAIRGSGSSVVRAQVRVEKPQRDDG